MNKEPIEEALDDKEAYYEEKRQNRQIINSEIVADASDDLLDLIEKKKNRSEILYDRLMQNKEEDRVIYGEVAGVRIESERVLVDVLWNGIRIIVPHSAYFQSSWNMGNNFDELSKEEKLLKIQRNAREMLGSYCPVVVKAVVKNPVEEGSFKGEDKIVGYGDRVEALAKLRKHYFFDRDMDDPNYPRPERHANAHVLMVAQDFAVVECMGCEYRIDSYNISDQYCDDCRDLYRAGDLMEVRIKKVTIEGDKVTLKISGILNDGSMMMPDIREGDTFIGYVKSFNKAKNIYTCKLNVGVNASVHLKSTTGHAELNIGDRVSVTVTGINGDYVF
ncbi:MAG: hypothetical protein IKR24_08660, partial [Erysipelotrichaceae bacterium]|nr:hypothetical protein [Erysipelotrichaceae bacterium]